MAILALGISHRYAPVELLERLAFAEDDYPKAYRKAIDAEAIDEAVILSTCNRVEVYAAVPSYHAGFQALKRLLCESHEVDFEELAEPLYSHYEEDAVQHLFSVAGGLDSMVLGEPQILAQVRAAHRIAEAEGATGPALSPVFRAAARAGRRIRTETTIGASPSAFVEAGSELAEDALGGLRGRIAVVVGAGQMAALAVRHLGERGVESIRVLNRSIDHARTLAARSGAEPGDLGALRGALATADFVVSTTGAAGIVIGEDAVREAIRERVSDRPLFILDIAVPRDVEPIVGTLPGVRLVDIDGVREMVSKREPELAEELDRARGIIADEVRRFSVRRRAERLAPVIAALHERGDRIRNAELARYGSRLAALTDEERAAVEALAKGIVSKLLHDPVVRLKELSQPGGEEAYARALAELFLLHIEPD